MTDLIERLLRPIPPYDMEVRIVDGRVLVNPDGPEAASELQSLSDRIAVLEGERNFVWKWVERGLFDANIDRLDALKTLAHYPGAPWNEGRWDVDHKPYAAAFYERFPKASLTKEGQASG